MARGAQARLDQVNTAVFLFLPVQLEVVLLAQEPEIARVRVVVVVALH